MSAVTAPSIECADMNELMLTIKRKVVIEMLSTFLEYAKKHYTQEVFNYVAINFILVMFSITSKHTDPDVVLGVNPQGCLEADFGKPVRTYPDWHGSSFRKALTAALLDDPQLAFIWEDKTLDLLPDASLPVSKEREMVKQAAEDAIPSHLAQLRKQAMCAFCNYKVDVFYTFLTFRDNVTLFKWVRMSNWDALEIKYGARYKDKKEWVFDDEDLPIPTVPYSCLPVLDEAKTDLSIYFRNAFKIATESLGFLHDQNPLFRLPPGITEEELKQPGKNKAQEAVDALNKVEPERPVPVDPSTVDDTVKDPNFTLRSQETSLATSAGSCDTGASEPTLSVVNFKVSTGSAGSAERDARHIARQERADAAQEPEEQSVADANEAPAMANADAELHLDANAGLPLNASFIFDPDEAQAFSTPAPVLPPNVDPANALLPTNDPVAPADAHEPIPDDGSANHEQPGAEQATAGPSNDGQSWESARPALAARTKRKKTTKTSGADAPDDAPAPAAGGPALAGPSNANAALVLAVPTGQNTRSSSRLKAQQTGVNTQSQSLNAPAADSAAKIRTSKKRSQPADNQGAGNAAAAPSRSKKRKIAPAAQSSDDAPGPSNTQRRVNPVRNCNKGGKKKIL
ncbi:hypothetical protein EWM64_g329 [Hericium alpestre]|uniref:Uncharacterized protein n=1 Tax=Hericium alpestre TaxID=135208 RepID=A0A4Z0ABN4_9AGAM|nr:hypothetical protein EWM64_g329 [Hericium alpestre]